MESKRKELQNQVDCLCKLRRETGMTRKAFSEYMDIPLRNLEEWEAGRRKMPDYLLRQIATILIWTKEKSFWILVMNCGVIVSLSQRYRNI